MDQTFMTIHNLSPEANILFASESIHDILGWQPAEVQGKSCFQYFHPDEVPFARSVHKRGVLLDKAAVLHYARILSRRGDWVSCECCFTVVHDCLVACTSIYRVGDKSDRRAIEAPQIRRIFSSSPKDPRYHMLEHLSPKFRMSPVEREPRAALILNRFTRTLTVMFATNAVSSVLGVRPEDIVNKSFYESIQEGCLASAVKALESAKANDSIAYLRYWSRDPRRDEDFGVDQGGWTYAMEDADVPMPGSGGEFPTCPFPSDCPASRGQADSWVHPVGCEKAPASQLHHTFRVGTHGREHRRPAIVPSVELEAVVSCTSDGLVVVLRRARPPIPAPHPPLLPPLDLQDGLFAAPWGQTPVQPYCPPEMLRRFQSPLLPQYMPYRESIQSDGGPPIDQLMTSIRDVAVFAWAIVGINGSLATYGRGTPFGGAQPLDLRGGEMTAMAERRGLCGCETQPTHPLGHCNEGTGTGQHEHLPAYQMAPEGNSAAGARLPGAPAAKTRTTHQSVGDGDYYNLPGSLAGGGGYQCSYHATCRSGTGLPSAPSSSLGGPPGAWR